MSNTTVQRPDSLRSKSKDETGGLSGEPLRIPSTQLIAEMYRYTEGKNTAQYYDAQPLYSKILSKLQTIVGVSNVGPATRKNVLHLFLFC